VTLSVELYPVEMLLKVSTHVSQEQSINKLFEKEAGPCLLVVGCYNKLQKEDLTGFYFFRINVVNINIQDRDFF